MHHKGIETFFKCRLIYSVALLLALLTAMANSQWTRNTTGCKCYFDSSSTDCACCNKGGCQCPRGHLHQCVQCDHGDQCGSLMQNYQWTRNTTGCQCYFDSGSTDCACCFPGGCQCSHKYRHQCVQCGYGGQCGKEMPNYPWTRNTTGCKCYFDSRRTNCACCHPGGCPCDEKHHYQCVQCGLGYQCGKVMLDYPWTRTTTGCRCYFETESSDCACCYPGGCQCDQKNRHQCVQCDRGDQCGKLMPNFQWTRNPTGCKCYFNESSTDCACCNPGGCQCPWYSPHQCVQCGHGDQCDIPTASEEMNIAVRTYWEQLLNYNNDNTESVELSITYETGITDRQGDSKTKVGTHTAGGSIEASDLFDIVSLELSYSYTHESSSTVMSENEIHETQVIETTVTIPPRSTLTRWQLFADVAGTKIGCSYYIDVINDTDSTPTTHKITGSAKVELHSNGK